MTGMLRLLATMVAVLTAVSAPAQVPERPVVLLDIEGAIGPATAEYVEKGLEAARQRGAAALVLRMDTPGGLDTSMRDIVRDVLAAPVPVITYVAPSGARAASAGTYILYASHVAAMAPGTNLGAATPVQVGGGMTPGAERKEEGEDAMTRKVVNDAVAYLRSLAELRGRNVEWAEKAVREGASLSASEAARLGVIDLTASSLAEALERVDGRTVTVGGAPHVLATAGAPIQAMEPDWRIELLSLLTNPNVAFLLLMIGVYGILFELASPGAVLPGVLGAICLVFGLYALAVLPVNYAGLALVLLGIAFMAGEAFVPSFGVLGIGGLVAFAIGAAILFDTEAPGFRLPWQTIAGATAISGVALLLLLAYVVRVQRRPPSTGRDRLIGSRGRVDRWSEAGGYVVVGGELWRAEADRPLSAGQPVRVVGLHGLTLAVEPLPPQSEGA